MKTFLKSCVFGLAVTLPLSWALAASGDVLYTKRSAPTKLSASQITALVNFIGQIAPSLTAANAVAVNCYKQSTGVYCSAQATAQAAPSTFVSDSVAGLVVSTSGTVP